MTKSSFTQSPALLWDQGAPPCWVISNARCCTAPLPPASSPARKLLRRLRSDKRRMNYTMMSFKVESNPPSDRHDDEHGWELCYTSDAKLERIMGIERYLLYLMYRKNGDSLNISRLHIYCTFIVGGLLLS